MNVDTIVEKMREMQSLNVSYDELRINSKTYDKIVTSLSSKVLEYRRDNAQGAMSQIAGIKIVQSDMIKENRAVVMHKNKVIGFIEIC